MDCWRGIGIACFLLALGACKEDKDEPEPEPEPEPDSYWLVGEDGMIYGFGVEDGPDSESDEASPDLLAIACDGTANAWIVGQSGTLMRTTDAGQSWAVSSLGVHETLRAVATRDGVTVVAVGDAGTVLASVDGGRTWDGIAGPDRDWRGVASGPAGAWLLVAARGEIWSLRPDGSFTELYQTDGQALHAIDGHHAEIAVSGEGGLVVRSGDGGATWEEADVPTSADLFAVDVLAEDHALVAAGAGGVIVVGAADEYRVVRDIEEGSILALHVSSEGHGAAVGAAGLFLSTADGGESWVRHDLGIAQDLHGLDQPFSPH